MSIPYAVIALTLDEVDEVGGRLRASQGMTGVANWFDANKGVIYGPRSDDWRPFGTKTIGEMLNNGENSFYSKTSLIDNLDEPYDDLDLVLEANIAVYFIDVFALFINKYRDLAARLDAAFAKSASSCCFVLPYGLSDDSETLLTQCSRTWPTVFKYYSNRGALHRFAVRAAELTNVRSYCLMRVSGGPNPGLESKVLERFGNNPKEVPRIATT